MSADLFGGAAAAGMAARARGLVEAVCNAMFAVVFVTFIYKIIVRYTLGGAVAWADELTVVLFIWIIFTANSFLLSERRQICFDLVERNLPPGGRRAAVAARSLLLGGIFLWSAPGALDYIAFLWRERTPVLLWRLDFVYSCFGIFLIASLARMALALVSMARPGWRDRL